MNTRGLATGAVVVLTLVVGVVLLYAARAQLPPTTVAPTSTATTAAAAPTSPTQSAAGTSSSAPSLSPSTSAAAGWTRGIYLQTIDPTVGFVPSNTRLISVTRGLQRSEVHNEIAWVSTGPWSPDGTAVVAADRTGQSYVIWPDNSLTRLEVAHATWTWLDAGSLGGVATTNGLELVQVNAHTGMVLKRDPIKGEGAQPTVSPTGDWGAYSTSSPDAPGQAITASKSVAIASGPLTHPAGWLPDGRFVFSRFAAGVTTVEARDPAKPDATVLGRFGTPVQALALPTSPVVVVHELRPSQLSTLRGTVQRLVPLQSAFAAGDTLEGISSDGRTLTFSGGNAPVGTLTGTIDLETGAFMYMCNTGCWRLVVN
jgi:hypothetical protein